MAGKINLALVVGTMIATGAVLVAFVGGL